MLRSCCCQEPPASRLSSSKGRLPNIPKLRLCSQVSQAVHIGPLQLSSAQSTRALAIIAAIGLLIAVIKRILDTPSRTYDPKNPNVGQSYDTWEQ